MDPDRIDDPELAWLAGLARVLIGAQSAGDLAQEALLAEIQRPAPRGVARRAWLAGIARRLASRELRGRARRRDRELRASDPEPPSAPDDLLERAEVAAAVSAAVRDLPEPFRRTVLLRHLEGMEPRAIAAAEGITPDAVRWRLRRGLALLRERLAPERDDMALFLLPLASAGGRRAAPAAASAASIFPALSVTLMSKGLFVTLGSAAALLAAFALAGGGGPREAGARARPEEPSPGRVASAPTGESIAAVEAPALDAQRATPGPAPAPLSTGAGVVLDASTREPIADARVAWLGDDGVARRGGSVVTGPDGRFRLETEDASSRIGVVANGHRRRAFETAGAERPWVIKLDPGRLLTGRLLDADRAPVAGVAVLATPAEAGVRHMSPTQRRLRRRARDDAFGGDPFEACCAVSGAAGDVRFSGLAFERVELLSLDPGWAVVGPGVVDAAATHVEWTLESRVGVRVSAVDAAGAPIARRVRSTFRVDVTFEDGSEMDIGQWVGRGTTSISMSLALRDLGDLGDSPPRSLRFHGVATTETERAEWRSAPIAFDGGWSGVAEATAVLEGIAPAEATSESSSQCDEVPLAQLELDVTFTDGTPCTLPLLVSWSGARGRGSVRARAAGPGRHVASLPATVERVEVSQRSAQGSIAPWSGEVALDAERPARVDVSLRRGARVTLARPLGFDGTWHVHASWRDGDTGAWSGSWGYGTDEDTLELEAIEPAEWRFTARRSQEPGEGDLVTVVRLAEGDDARVTW